MINTDTSDPAPKKAFEYIIEKFEAEGYQHPQCLMLPTGMAAFRKYLGCLTIDTYYQWGVYYRKASLSRWELVIRNFVMTHHRPAILPDPQLPNIRQLVFRKLRIDFVFVAFMVKQVPLIRPRISR